MKWMKMITVTLLTAIILAGCSGSDSSKAEYVQGLLDIAYNKGTEVYVKAADVKEEDAKNYSQQALEAEAKVMAAYFGIEEPSEEVLKSFQGFCEKMYKEVSYKVEAKGDRVQVSTNQIIIGSQSEALQNYVDDFNIRQFVDGDASCTDEAFAKGAVEVMEQDLKKLFCGTQTKTIEVTVTEKDGKMSVSDKDLENLDSQIIVYD